MKKVIKNIFAKMGLAVIAQKTLDNPYDMDADFFKIYEQCKPYTMTSVGRMYSVYQTVKYIVGNNVQGDFVECGVWKGGSSMMAALSFIHFGDTSRKMYLYDTFEGMSVPTDKDVTYYGEDGRIDWKKNEQGDHNEWCYSPIGEVSTNMDKTGYPEENIIYVKGKVEDTIPGTMPEKISVLRLDTDWYESIYHCLVHQYPLLVEKGILIIDDYGYWKGAREAVDQYFEEQKIVPLLNRIDTTGRLYVKV